MARRSALAGAHPASGQGVEPEQQAVPEQAERPEVPEQPEPEERAERQASQNASPATTSGDSSRSGDSGGSGDTRTASTPEPKRTGRAAKTTLTVDPDVLAEAKDGYWVALSRGRHRTFAEYVTAALDAYNQAMRDEYTGGKEFPPRPSGNLPTTQLS